MEWVQHSKDRNASILKYSLCKYTALGLQSNHLPHPNHSERAPSSTLFALGSHMQLLKLSLVRTFSSSELQYEDSCAFGSCSVYHPFLFKYQNNYLRSRNCNCLIHTFIMVLFCVACKVLCFVFFCFFLITLLRH